MKMHLPLLTPLCRIAYRLAQPVMVLDVSHLLTLDAESLRQPVEPPAGYRIVPMTEDDVRGCAYDARHELSVMMSYRLLFNRDFCIAAWDGDKLAGYAWFALGSIEAEHNRGRKPASGCAVSFPGDTAFLYKALVLPEHRGKKLYQAINTFALEYLKQHGVTRILATTDWSNGNALKSCYKLGFRRIGRTCLVGFGRVVLGIHPWKARRMGIRFGWRAEVNTRHGGLIAVRRPHGAHAFAALRADRHDAAHRFGNPTATTNHSPLPPDASPAPPITDAPIPQSAPVSSMPVESAPLPPSPALVVSESTAIHPHDAPLGIS